MWRSAGCCCSSLMSSCLTSRPTIWICQPLNGWKKCFASIAGRFWWSVTTAPFCAILAPESSGSMIASCAAVMGILTNLRHGQITFLLMRRWCFTRWIAASPAKPNGHAKVFRQDANAIQGGFANLPACAQNAPELAALPNAPCGWKLAQLMAAGNWF